MAAQRRASRRFSVLVDADAADSTVQEAANLLLSLPWELVHDGDGYLFQGANGVRVRRQLPKREQVKALVTTAPLRVLFVAPRPEDDKAEYIDHRMSAKPLVECLNPLGKGVDFSVLQPPTFKAMAAEIARARKADRPYHVVHFNGHGIYDRRIGLGALCFEHPADSDKLTWRRTKIIQADKIAEVMRDHRVPLVYLEACQSAMAEKDPTASVAGRLLNSGVASVVAMSHSVLVATAKRFVKPFYTSLVGGERVGDAMLAGQCELANDATRGTSFVGELELQDWFVPVLYQEEIDPPLVQPVVDEGVKHVVARGRTLSLGQLPKEPDHAFVGRSRELLAVERLLERERHAVVLGEGGEGKTTLAAELARWLVASRRFARAAFVSVEHALDLRALVHALGDQLVAGFAGKAGRDPEQAVPLIERALRERPTLVVVDNMESVLPPPAGAQESAAPERAFEPALLDGILQLCQRLGAAGETRLVFTSREALPPPFDSRRTTVRIGRLDRADAVALVGRVLGEQAERPRRDDEGDSEDEMARLVDAVNRHARSLVLVAREVAASGVRGATDRLEQLMAAMAARHGDDREQSLYASVELSLRRLPAETRRRLPPLGVFQGGGHLFVIDRVLELGGADAVRELAEQLAGAGLGELLSYGHLRLHPALAPLLRAELDEAALDAARQAWVQGMVALAGYLRQQQSQDIQLAATLTILELPNLLAALERLQATAGAEEVVGVATTLEGLLQDLGRPRAMARVVRVREAASKGLGDWTHGRCIAEDAAIDRLLEAGRFAEAVQAARATLERASAAGEDAYEVAAFDLAMAHFSLGRASRMSGAAEAALAPLDEAQRRFQQLGDAGNQAAQRMASAAMTERGDCFRDLGRLDEAAAVYEEAINLDQGRGAHRDVAVGKGQLGTVRLLQRRFDEALRAWNEARETFEQLGEPGAVAAAWHQIGVVHQKAGQLEAAEHAYQQSLRIEVQRRDRGGEGDTLDQLGLLYRRMGRAEESVRFHRQAADILTELGDRLREGRSRNNVAIVLLQLRRFDEARREVERAIVCDRPYGHAAEPWKTLGILHDLERAAGGQAAAARARDQAIAAFLAYRRAGGENHLPGGRLAAAVAHAVDSGDTGEAASQLAALAVRPDLSDYLRALIPVLQQVLDGGRDPALASTAGLHYTDAVEVQLLVERPG